jgi:acetyl-CoA synthetase
MIFFLANEYTLKGFIMSESTTPEYPVAAEFVRQSNLNLEQYRKMYDLSVKDPQHFWSEQAQKFVTWFKPWDAVLTGSFENGDTAWFQNATLNAAYNCLDRHLEKRAQQTAIIWEGDDPSDIRKVTYAELCADVCRFANALKKLGVKKGSRVCIYMPMVPETVVAMLACARIGAVHSVVFGGFSADALKTRIVDADCQLVITANESLRGKKIIPLKKNVDTAIEAVKSVTKVIVVKRTENPAAMQAPRDVWYHDIISGEEPLCPPVMVDAHDPLFILYTSGSTGKPKGILHGTGGYLVFAAMTHHYIFDYHDGEIYWCTADVGWITGHTYSVYGPLLNGATILLFESIPHYPSFSRFWEIIDRHQVNIFYTAPTAIRALRREGDSWVTKTSRASLKLLGTVGEPINPEVWDWYYKVVGGSRCPVVDTWWQTETGGILISPLPGATPLKPGSAGWPFFGIEPAIVDELGKEVARGEMGKLVIKKPWPGMLQTVFKNRDRFMAAYFNDYPGKYLTGDDARCDQDGYYWITGRNDDVLKVSGHRIGTGEVESALLQHTAAAEAAVVEVPHDVKGNSIYAFISLKEGKQGSDELKKELIQTVRSQIGAIAAPDYIQWADALPKTRSGKIMRRLLRKIANNDLDDLGDTSTLAEPQVVDSLIANRIPIR